MTTMSVDRIIEDYLGRLDAALDRLPAGRRRQLIAEITEHIEYGRSQLPDQTESAVRDLLDRVGQPEDIASEALAEEPEQIEKKLRHGWIVATPAVIVLVLGGIGAWAVVAHDHQGTPPPRYVTKTIPKISTSTSAPSTTAPTSVPSTTAPAPTGPTLATCTSAVSSYYLPPVSWFDGGTISSNERRGCFRPVCGQQRRSDHRSQRRGHSPVPRRVQRGADLHAVREWLNIALRGVSSGICPRGHRSAPGCRGILRHAGRHLTSATAGGTATEAHIHGG
jgi:hypothetical protein